jgi:hypothetical protein
VTIQLLCSLPLLLTFSIYAFLNPDLRSNSPHCYLEPNSANPVPLTYNPTSLATNITQTTLSLFTFGFIFSFLPLISAVCLLLAGKLANGILMKSAVVAGVGLMVGWGLSIIVMLVVVRVNRVEMLACFRGDSEKYP